MRQGKDENLIKKSNTKKEFPLACICRHSPIHLFTSLSTEYLARWIRARVEKAWQKYQPNTAFMQPNFRLSSFLCIYSYVYPHEVYQAREEQGITQKKTHTSKCRQKIRDLIPVLPCLWTYVYLQDMREGDGEIR